MNNVPTRHPGGRTCRGLLPTALLLTLAAMWRHRSELARYVRDGDR